MTTTKVRVRVTIEVDTEAWMSTYGCATPEEVTNDVELWAATTIDGALQATGCVS